MALDDSEPRQFWRWTVENDGQPLVSPTMHHCRLAFVVNDRVADDFNFIVVMANDNSESVCSVKTISRSHQNGGDTMGDISDPESTSTDALNVSACDGMPPL